MQGLLASLLSFVLLYKFTAIFIITFLGAFALSLPSGSVVMAAAAFASQGYFDPWAVFATALAGNLAGDSSGYWLVRRYGIKILQSIHLKKFFPPERLSAARGQIEAHPILAIFLSRFMTAVAPAVNVVCGLTKLPYKKFLTFEVLGEITEVGCFCLLGYMFGSNWEYLSHFADRFWIMVLAGLLASYALWHVLLRKKRR